LDFFNQRVTIEIPNAHTILSGSIGSSGAVTTVHTDLIPAHMLATRAARNSVLTDGRGMKKKDDRDIIMKSNLKS
jgi:hypothetical protein